MKKLLKYTLGGILLAWLALFLAVLFFPEPSFLNNAPSSSKIYDRHGELLYEILNPFQGKREIVSLDKISSHFLNAILAIEDQDFYQHFGIDFSALLRAFWQNIYYGEVVSGASTIEQQLARNLLKHQERSLKHKIQEVLLALKLNLKYSKSEILEKYVNTIYFGNLAYGIESASQTYFGKKSSQLDLAESAYLAALPQAPSRYNPYANLKFGKSRQEQILKILDQKKQVTESEFLSAQKEALNFQKQKLVEIKAPHFVMWLLEKLEQQDLLQKITQGNYKIQTTLDLGLQNEIQNLVNLHLKKLKQKKITNAAVLVLDQTNGEILAMLGGRDYFDAEIDGEVNVITALRQPGSTLKPFLYASAFASGFSPETMIRDEKVQFQTAGGHPYEPQNYDLSYHGVVTLREALAQSLNIPAVKILNFLSVSTFLDSLKSLGFSSLNRSSDYYGLALALGSGEVKLIELTKAYAILANQGKALSLQSIQKITLNSEQDLTSEYLQDTFLKNHSELIPSSITNQITSILADNYARLPAFGEENDLKFNYPVAAKTGTSRNFRDNWTIGYTPLRTVGVWVGNNDASEMINSSGMSGAAPLFKSVMNLVMQDLPKQKFLEVQSKPDFISDFDEIIQKQNLNSEKAEMNLILSPFNGDIFKLSSTLPLEKQVLSFKARQEGTWFLNGEKKATTQNWQWQLTRGEYEVLFQTKSESQKIFFKVI